MATVIQSDYDDNDEDKGVVSEESKTVKRKKSEKQTKNLAADAKVEAVPIDPDNILNPEDDEAIAGFLHEMRQHGAAFSSEIRKIGPLPGQKLFKLGPDFVDDECTQVTQVPQQTSDEEVQAVASTQQASAFQRERGPALNWDPNPWDLEEDFFFQETVIFPTDKLAFSLPQVGERVKKKRVKEFKPDGDFIVKTRFYIDLTESQTVFLLLIPGSLVMESDEKFPLITQKNEKYLEMVQRHLETTDSRQNNNAQTFENYKLSKYTDHRIQKCVDVGTDCHVFYIEDDYKKVAEEEAKRIIREKELEEKRLWDEAHMEASEAEAKSSDSDDSTDEEQEAIQVDAKQKQGDEPRKSQVEEDNSEDELPMSSEDELEFETTPESIFERKRLRAKKKRLRIYPDISSSISAVQRIICLDAEERNVPIAF